MGIAELFGVKRIPIVVVGASAGGVEAVAHIARELPQRFPAALFISMHFPATVTSVLPQILARAGKLVATHPEDGERFEPGHIYVAPPDFHLLIGATKVRVVRGPRENGHRPAIDPMFRSAAISHGNRVIGVLLTGNLDDGTAGLLAIKRHGGIAVVQDPDDALFKSMPQSALENVAVDHVVPLAQIARTIETVASDIVSLRPEPSRQPQEDAMPEREVSYDELDLSTIEDVEAHPGRPSQFGCPDCGGVLWRIEDGSLLRYRCRVGHAWTGDGLRSRQQEQLDAALWMALRTLEEHVSLSEQLAERSRKRGIQLLVRRYEREADEARVRARTIRDFLLRPAATIEADSPAPAATG